ncbi:hypothetical protein ACIO3S_08255 [Nocardioides sp. NPDC087217]|uniref:esterase/lipase family protein n=1 Tax=Nocardioides sp. NPDC087217 TaxID=3364335 RepID=UPI0038031AEB
MTWISSGPAFGSPGFALDEDGAVESAIDEAGGFAEAADQVFTARDTSAAIDGAVRRWRGDADDADPFLARRDVPGRRSLLQLEIGRDLAVADTAFASFVVPPGVEELSLTFVDDGETSTVSALAGFRRNGFVLSGRDDQHTYILVDAFIGNSTTRQTFLAKVTNGIASVFLRLHGQVAVILGVRLQVYADRREARDTDPTWIERLHAVEQRPEYVHLTQQHPQLRSAPSGPAAIAVLIHGTFSSCVPALPDVSPLAGTTPLYRFEHDTLRPVAENVDDLISALKRIDSTQVTLIGHSRGGLVATMAAADLSTITQVLTLGTPHNGTPLAAAGDNLLGYALATFGTQFKSILDGGLRAGHVGSMLPQGHLPDGWTDMLPHSSFIRLLRRQPRKGVTAYGGAFDGAQPGLGILPGLAAETMTFLTAGDHDLVVPLDSSKPAELPGQELAQVHHFGYFTDRTVQAAIQKALQPPTVPSPTAHSNS